MRLSCFQERIYCRHLHVMIKWKYGQLQLFLEDRDGKLRIGNRQEDDGNRRTGKGKKNPGKKNPGNRKPGIGI